MVTPPMGCGLLTSYLYLTFLALSLFFVISIGQNEFAGRLE